MIIENRIVLAVLEELRKKGVSTIEAGIDLVTKKNFQLESDKDEIDLYSNSSKSSFFLKKLKFEIKNSVEKNYEKNIARISYSLKTKKVTFHFCDGRTIVKKFSDVEFDILGIDGSELFNYLA